MARRTVAHALFSAVVAGFLASPARADWPNLNPFSSGDKARERRDDSGSAAWPKLGWPGSADPKPAPSGPSTWTKVKRGTSSTFKKAGEDTTWLFRKTGDVLNPFNDADDAPPRPASRSPYAFGKPADERKNSSWWKPTGWFSSSDDER